MKTNLYQRIIKLVKQRERSYEMIQGGAGWGKAEKLKAISAIKHKMNFYRDKSAKVQAKVIWSLRGQLLTIAPGERSRFQGVRSEIISLIQECENIKESLV